MTRTTFYEIVLGMKDEDYVDEMLKIGDCGDCCPEGALIDKPEIVDQIKEMDVIPTYGGSK